MTLFSFAAPPSAVLLLHRPFPCGPVACTAGLSESSDINPKSSVSLREAGLVSSRVTSNRFGDSGGGGGGSTGLGRKASEESTQSPTEDEMVAAQMEKALSNSYSLYLLIILFFLSSCVHSNHPKYTFNTKESLGLLMQEESLQVPGVRNEPSTCLQDSGLCRDHGTKLR